MTTKTITEVAKASVDVRNFIQGNGYLPELITINGVRVNRASFLRMVCASILELTKPKKKQLNILTDSYPNPSQKTDNVQDKTQLMKQDYIKLATEINTFIRGNGRCPELYTTRYGQLSFYGVIWTLSRVLAFYKENNYLPNYVVLENRFQNTPTKSTLYKQIENAIGGTFNTATELYQLIQANEKYEYYYNDIYPQGQAIQRLQNNQGLNCSDFAQIGMAALIEINKTFGRGYDADYVVVGCKPSGAGHVFLRVKGGEFGNTRRDYDLAEAASGGGSIGSTMCSNGYNVKATNPQWLISDDGKT